MIKVMSIEDNNVTSVVASLYADTKSEVPATGTATATAMSNFNFNLEAGSVLYTSSLDIAVLKSDDTWNWGD